MDISEYSYGVTEQFVINDEVDEKVLELKINGFTTVESRMNENEIGELKVNLDRFYSEQADALGGHEQLVKWGDANILRGALTHHKSFLSAATNTNLLNLATRYLGNEFVLTMQNGLINKPGHGNEQGKFHRDLNYQHWTSSSPLAMNALLCLDDFTIENGATWVTPGSHNLAEFPSRKFLDKFSLQVTAKAGTYLVLDGMLFHKAGANRSSLERRALNHVIGLPFMGQVIDLPRAMALNGVPMPSEPRLQRYLGSQWGSVGSATEWRKKKFSN